MDTTNAPQDKGHPDSAPPPLENQLRALEQRITEHKNELRDYEKSLVDRIADVDDDRRTTVSKLQRAWQTQREEVNNRLSRHTVVVISALVLLLVVFGAALYLTYRHMETERQALTADLAELKQVLAGTPRKSAEADPVRDELNRLSAAVEELASSRGRQGGEQADSLDTILEDERIARDAANAVLGEEIRRLEVTQRNLKREVVALRDTLADADAEQAAAARASDDSAIEKFESDPPQGPLQTTTAPPTASSGISATVPTGSSPDEASAGVVEQAVSTADEQAKDLGTGADKPETMVVTDRTYALQLIGFYNWDALLKFAGRDDLPERLYYREEFVQKRPWYALIHSLHKDYAAASAELDRLTPELIDMNPWIRPIREGVEIKVLSDTNIDNVYDSQKQP